MTTRDSAPVGAPCWADLWTSDVEGSRRFYCDLFGWEAQEPSPEFGGYFMFTRDGVPIAGGMGDMGDLRREQHVEGLPGHRRRRRDGGGRRGRRCRRSSRRRCPSPTSASRRCSSTRPAPQLGAWQPGTFPGFTVLDEHGAPSWFELHTRDHRRGRRLLPHRCSTGRPTTSATATSSATRPCATPSGEGELAGIMDASGFLPEGVPAHWSVYWEVDDVDATVAKVTVARRLGRDGARSTPPTAGWPR